MLDIKFVRENSDLVRKDLEKRQDTEKLKWVDTLLEKDEEYRKVLVDSQDLRKKRNDLSKEVNKLKKEGKDISKVLKEVKEIPQKIKETEEKIKELQDKIKYYQMRLPNILHSSVPYGKDDSENQEVKKWGDIKEKDFELKPHGELIEKKGLADFEQAAKVAGRGFYYLMGDMALMEQALQRFAIDLLVKKGYSLVEPPLMLRRKPYEGVTDLADFENIMYRVEGGEEDLFLIATSEHPIGALMMNKVLDEKDMPLKYIGVSPCFRKEIGSHGVDERGLFRVHQFNKIEQFIFCKPEESWKFHEELIANAEELFKKLKLPYKVVNICTGDIGIVAAKKYDIEAYMPREKEYKEVVSCSNCTSYQAVRLNIKYRKGNEKEYIHTLNSTAIATGRALRAIIENYQEKDGSIKVPTVLQPYMGGKKVIGN